MTYHPLLNWSLHHSSATGRLIGREHLDPSHIDVRGKINYVANNSSNVLGFDRSVAVIEHGIGLIVRYSIAV